MQDTQNLFSQNLEQWFNLNLQDGDVRIQQGFLSPGVSADLFFILYKETPWKTRQIELYGKTYDQPRLIAWYGNPEATYSYSGVMFQPLAWTETLLRVKQLVEIETRATFNSVLLNLYRNQNDSISLHSDDEFGLNPTIASLSLGESRKFVLKHKTEKRTVRFCLHSGDLLLMQGETQQHWKHGIDKSRKPCGARINLTFRLIEKG